MILQLGTDPVYVITREGATRQWLMSRAAGVALTQTSYRFLRLPDELLPEPPGEIFYLISDPTYSPGDYFCHILHDAA